MNQKKTAVIAARLAPDLRRRLDRIAELYGPADATMIEDALSALADYVAESKRYARPMKMIFDRERADTAAVVAEEMAHYAAIARTPVDTTAEELSEKLLALVRAHPLFHDARVVGYFLPALRRHLIRRLDEAAVAAGQQPLAPSTGSGLPFKR